MKSPNQYVYNYPRNVYRDRHFASASVKVFSYLTEIYAVAAVSAAFWVNKPPHDRGKRETMRLRVMHATRTHICAHFTQTQPHTRLYAEMCVSAPTSIHFRSIFIFNEKRTS